MTSAKHTDEQVTMLDTSCHLRDRLAAIVLVAESSLAAERKEQGLLACLDDSDPTIRETAITGIGIANLPTEKILHRLTQLIDDGTGSIQCEAFRIYCQLGGPRSAELAAHMLHHGSLEQRVLGIGALMNSGTREACWLLESYWNSSGLEQAERVVVAMALARYGNTIGEKFLENELASGFEIRMPIVASLAFIGNKTGLLTAKRILLSGAEMDRKWLAFNMTELLGFPLTNGDDASTLQWIETKLGENRDSENGDSLSENGENGDTLRKP